eukprot:g36150.t1
MKLKRTEVYAKYKKEIQAMYFNSLSSEAILMPSCESSGKELLKQVLRLKINLRSCWRQPTVALAPSKALQLPIARTISNTNQPKAKWRARLIQSDIYASELYSDRGPGRPSPFSLN